MVAQTRITELEGDRDRLRADLAKAQERVAGVIIEQG